MSSFFKLDIFHYFQAGGFSLLKDLVKYSGYIFQDYYPKSGYYLGYKRFGTL